ncbi:hypothetical protein PFISCL1PPCAC_25818, partial [Pristionchus fissidentatus]
QTEVEHENGCHVLARAHHEVGRLDVPDYESKVVESLDRVERLHAHADPGADAEQIVVLHHVVRLAFPTRLLHLARLERFEIRAAQAHDDEGEVAMLAEGVDAREVLRLARRIYRTQDEDLLLQLTLASRRGRLRLQRGEHRFLIVPRLVHYSETAVVDELRDLPFALVEPFARLELDVFLHSGLALRPCVHYLLASFPLLGEVLGGGGSRLLLLHALIRISRPSHRE